MVLDMSKRQEFFRSVFKGLGFASLWVIATEDQLGLHESVAPAPRDFIGIETSDLLDMVGYAKGTRSGIQMEISIFSDNPLIINELQVLLNCPDCLIQRALIELLRREHLTDPQKHYLGRLMSDMPTEVAS